MNTQSLKTKIVASFFTLIVVIGMSIALLGFYVIKNDIIKRAQTQVQHHLKAAWLVFNGEIDLIQKAVDVISAYDDLEGFRQTLGLDYLYFVPEQGLSHVRSAIVLTAARNRENTRGTRVITRPELERMDPDLAIRTRIDIVATPKARPTVTSRIEDALALEYARPVFSEKRHLKGVLYGGKVLNRNFSIVDRIHELVFERKLYKGKPMGTVTIFQDDVRIATNVLNKEGARAIGTRVSERVYDNVIVQGKSWVDKAFVVTDWYLTAYEPIRDRSGTIIGILYVGLLEQPFVDMLRRFSLFFILIILGTGMLAVFLSFVLADMIVRPLQEMLSATAQYSQGALTHRIAAKSPIQELNALAASFNVMAEKLNERETSLKISNDRLEELNKSYLDLVSFVAHELKGILGVAILNAYSVRDGFLGMVNFKQRKALDAVCRNLDYFAATVKNFFNLSRIEKSELKTNPVWILIREDVFSHAIETFSKQAQEKQMNIVNHMPEHLLVKADADLLEMVANNLVGNAVKYGRTGGQIVLRAEDTPGGVRVEVYNDGVPLIPEEQDLLFKKFSRVTSELTKKVKGTGLGLFITRQIIEKHGGSIWMEARPQGNAFILQLPKEV